MKVETQVEPTVSSTIDLITIQAGSLEQLEELLSPHTRYTSHICVISDNTVMAQYGDTVLDQIKLLNIPSSTILLPQGEVNKSLETLTYCWEQMAELQLDRRSLVIALGGGIITDVAGFAASTFMRGIDLISIPTTLMGMCDASVGGKNGINFKERKSLIGNFHIPKTVIIDPACLTSLPKKELCAGLAEIIKCSLINNPDFFEWLESSMTALLAADPSALVHAIEQAVQIKQTIVAKDPHDHGVRATLNLGHTFAHAIESLTNYQQYLHGEAVSIGLCCAAQLSQQLGFIDESIVEKVESLCSKAGLPIRLPNVSDEAIIEKMVLDKKAQRSSITCIVAKAIGNVTKLDNIAPQIVKESLLQRRKKDARQAVAATTP